MIYNDLILDYNMQFEANQMILSFFSVVWLVGKITGREKPGQRKTPLPQMRSAEFFFCGRYKKNRESWMISLLPG